MTRRTAVLLVVLVSLGGGCLGPPALPDPLAAGWKGERVCVVLVDDPGLRALRCTFPPGVGHERHAHAPHLVHVISGGRMRIDDDKGVREVDVPTGATYRYTDEVRHEVRNVGTSTAVFLIIEPK